MDDIFSMFGDIFGGRGGGFSGGFGGFLGTSVAAVVLVGCWMAITAFALVARGMRNLDDAAPDLKREEGALEEARLDS